MNTFIFYYENMTVGGAQLLIMNYANELVSKGINVVILCKRVDNLFLKENTKVQIKSLGNKEWNSDKCLKGILKGISDASIITFLWPDYARVYSLKDVNQKLIFYAIHYDAVKFAAYSGHSFIDCLMKRFLSSTIKSLIRKKNIVMMDEQTMCHSEEYYNFDCHNASIIHIPVNNTDPIVTYEEIERRLKNEEKRILAIARADFPFKGYLLGLVDAVKDDIIPSDYFVTIVSYGKDEIKLKQEIEKLNEEKKKRVTLLGKMPYKELRNLFINATIYIGMGTSLLDASKYGVVSIPVVADTNKLLCKSFFHENPEWVAIEDGSENAVNILVQKYENLSKEEKRVMMNECVDIVNNTYNLEKNTNELIRLFLELDEYKNIRIVISYYLEKIKVRLYNMIGGLK